MRKDYDVNDNSSPNEAPPLTGVPSAPARRWVPILTGLAVLACLGMGGIMVMRSESRTNKVPLSAMPTGVSVVKVQSVAFRSSRTYVGAIEPWLEASVGPQLVAAYVDTVLVRPGSVVKRGDVIATLDCRNTNAGSQMVVAEARGVEARQRALADESARVQVLLDGGFVSPNEAEQKLAQSTGAQAQLDAQRAALAKNSLAVNDCVLRAPFDGEVATRTIDPGAFLRPGVAVASIIDRSIVRLVGEAPERDFDVVTPSTKVSVHLVATGEDLEATITRRTPRADAATRTVQFEIDVADPDRRLPVGTTVEMRINVGQPAATTEVPFRAGTVRGTKVNVFVVEDGIAHSRTVQLLGERDGKLYVDPSLKAESEVVVQGRGLLSDGDAVKATLEVQPPSPAKADEKGATP